MSIPGLVEDDIVINVNGNYVSIRGERQPPYDSNRDTQLQEWRYGYFERRFKLTSEVSVDGIRGSYEAGVLTIVVEKLKPNLTNNADGFGDRLSGHPDFWAVQ